MLEQLGKKSVLGGALLDTTNVAGASVYVDPSRIIELRHLVGSSSFSPVKLIRLCEDLNACMSSKAYLAAIMVVRAIKDHVPPVFGCKHFAEVVAQTKGKSFNEQLNRLDSQAKNVADRFLHEQIKSVEALPNAVQIDFRSELDALLAEVVARLSKQ